jgi:hypothetical protein
MVKDDLLVIEKHDRETRDRHTSQEVDKRLRDMLHDCETNEDYACKPAPRLDAVNEIAMEGHRSRNC